VVLELPVPGFVPVVLVLVVLIRLCWDNQFKSQSAEKLTFPPLVTTEIEVVAVVVGVKLLRVQELMTPLSVEVLDVAVCPIACERSITPSNEKPNGWDTFCHLCGSRNLIRGPNPEVLTVLLMFPDT
jgi:hypothetical protein